MARSLQFKNAIDAAMQTYQTLLTAMTITMLLKTTRKDLKEDKTPPDAIEDSHEALNYIHCCVIIVIMLLR